MRNCRAASRSALLHGARGGHLLADYAANGSAQIRQRGDPGIRNIRFATIIVAPRFRHYYGHAPAAPRNNATPGASVLAAGNRSSGGLMDRLLRYFLGQFVRRG